MNKILCLDFDGVICDSLQECLLTSYIAYRYYINKNIDVGFNIEIPKNIQENFYQYRYLVKPAKQYGMLQYLLNNNELINAETFAKSLKDSSFSMDEYEPIFFMVRSKLISLDLSHWLEMNTIYPHVLMHWDSITSRIPTYIVTNKNYNSVKLLLEHYKLDFNESNIYAKEKNHSKADTLIALADENQIQLEKLIFIDDNSTYISEMLGIGIQAYLACWGYEKMNVPSHFQQTELINDFGDLDNLINTKIYN